MKAAEDYSAAVPSDGVLFLPSTARVAQMHLFAWPVQRLAARRHDPHTRTTRRDIVTSDKPGRIRAQDTSRKKTAHVALPDAATALLTAVTAGRTSLRGDLVA